jgi:Transposase DDE domain
LSGGVAEAAPKLSEQELRQWKLVADFRARLESVCPREEQGAAWQHPRRRLEQWDYLCLFLFALLNPTVKTLRALSAASGLKRVQEEVCTRQTALGSLSEAQHLLEPELLEQLLGSLCGEIQGPLPEDPHQGWQSWLARDSSIFPATARMFWAKHGAGKAGAPNHAVRFHVSLHLWEDKPGKVAVTPGRVCERKVWREQLEPGATYVGDRYFAEDYKMFARLQELGCHFVLRLRDEAVLNVEEELPVSAAEQKQGVVGDVWGALGSSPRYRTERLRVVTVRKPSGTLMRLVTNFTPAEMSAGMVLTLYRRRWQIECFFRWIKCLLGCRHWLAQSQRGVTVQLYLAVIAGLLLQLVLGRRPNRRLWERLQLYLMGWATLEELMSAVNVALEKTGAKKS